MSDKNFKTIRKQLRGVVQEMIPDVLTNEFMAAIHKSVAADMQKRMDEIANNARETLKIIDERQKDLQNYLARILEQVSPPVPSSGLPDSTPPTDTL